MLYLCRVIKKKEISFTAMINRVLIRIKVLQILFACSQNQDNDLATVEKELSFSLKKAYDLYFYLLRLMVEITEWQRQKLDMAKHKYLPTQEELNPNLRLVQNRFIAQLMHNKTFISYTEENAISWVNNREIIKHLLGTILESDIYKEYISSANDDYEEDKEFWRKILKQVICQNENFLQDLEDMSIYWNDDLGIIETFVLKTIRRFEEENGEDQELLPMFKNEDDKEFAIQLLRASLLNENEYNTEINKYLKNWDMERIAGMDMVILRTAIAEIFNFPTIPTTVTLNEYIEIAKAYSTPKSAIFINGILDAMVKNLKAENKLLKK